MESRFERLDRQNIENIRRLLGADRKVSPKGKPVSYPGTPKRAKASVARQTGPVLNSNAREVVSYLAQRNIDALGVPPGFFDRQWHLANRSCARACLSNIERDVSFWKRLIDYGFKSSFHRRRMSRMLYVKRTLLPEYISASGDRPGGAGGIEERLKLEEMIRKGKVVGAPNKEFDPYFDEDGNRQCQTGSSSI